MFIIWIMEWSFTCGETPVTVKYANNFFWHHSNALKIWLNKLRWIKLTVMIHKIMCEPLTHLNYVTLKNTNQKPSCELISRELWQLLLCFAIFAAPHPCPVNLMLLISSSELLTIPWMWTLYAHVSYVTGMCKKFVALHIYCRVNMPIYWRGLWKGCFFAVSSVGFAQVLQNN